MADADLQVYKLVFGQVVASLRKRSDFTQEQFAELVQMSQPTLSRVERGLVLPDVYAYRLIASELRLSIGEIDRRVDDALRRSKVAAAGIVGKRAKDDEFWGGVVAATDMTAIRGLIWFSVAVMVGELPSLTPPTPPTG